MFISDTNAVQSTGATLAGAPTPSRGAAAVLESIATQLALNKAYVRQEYTKAIVLWQWKQALAVPMGFYCERFSHILVPAANSGKVYWPISFQWR